MGYGYVILANVDEAQQVLNEQERSSGFIKFINRRTNKDIILLFDQYKERDFRQQGKHFDDIGRKFESKKKVGDKEQSMHKVPTGGQIASIYHGTPQKTQITNCTKNLVYNHHQNLN